MAKPFVTFAQRLYNCYSHCPCARPAHMAESWPSALLQVLQNSESRMLIFKPYQCEMATHEIREEENNKESTAI